MQFVLGTALLVAAIILLGVAKYAISLWEKSFWVTRLAGTQALALAITMLGAFGVAFLSSGLAADHSNVGYAEFAAAIGAIVAATIGVIRTFRRRMNPPAPAPVTSANVQT